MLRTWNLLKFEQAIAPEEGSSAGGTPPPAAAVSDVDEFGYAVEPSVAAPEEKKADAPADEVVEEIKDPVSGYTEEPQPEVQPDPPAAPPPEPEVKLEYELEAKDLDAKEVTKIKELALKHKLPKEAAQDLLDQKLAEVKAAAKILADNKAAQEKAVQAVKSKWDSELRKDPTFGGDKFNKNVMMAEKVLSEFMPETKKALTERKSMLPPYVMRDLAQLASKLYKPEKMIQGEPTIAEKKIESSEDAHLSFYT
jgi:hypothetical protein